MSNQLYGILTTILAEKAGTRVNGRVASERTKSKAGEELKSIFHDLERLGYRLQNPRNLESKHVQALCTEWHANGKAVSTMTEYLSRLRIFARWIGKPGMVKSLPDYLPHVDKALLKSRKKLVDSKSWAEHGIDIAEKIAEADALDWRFGLMLRMQVAFGLRRKEVVICKPHVADHGHKLAIFSGESKNGKPRDVYVDNEEQRAVVEICKAAIKNKREHIGWVHTRRGKKASYEFSLGEYNRMMGKIGISKEEALVTGHGLRAQYAESAALIAHMIPPSLGGTPGQMDRQDLNVKREKISEALGHHRLNITNAYYGSFGRKVELDDVARCKNNILAAVPYLKPATLPAIDPERTQDCSQLLNELAPLEIDLTLKQVQQLWKIHSQRFGFPWVEIRNGNAAALEAAAISLVKRKTLHNTKLEKQAALDLLEEMQPVM